ncbi:MAG: hypothetical protein ACRCYZ_05560, partial [Alphaproteobacteria bacterium]
KKHQLKKLAEKPQQKTDVELGKTDSNLSKPESHYGSAHDIPVRKSILQTMGHDTYGNPPEFLPGGDAYQGNVKAASETIIPSQQSARPASMVTQPMRPQPVVEENDEYGKIPTLFPEGSHLGN